MQFLQRRKRIISAQFHAMTPVTGVALIAVAVEELEQSTFFGLEARFDAFDVSELARPELVEQNAFLVGRQDGWMDVGTPADARRIAELFGDFFDGFYDILFRLSFVFAGTEFGKLNGGKKRRSPGSKIF